VFPIRIYLYTDADPELHFRLFGSRGFHDINERRKKILGILLDFCTNCCEDLDKELPGPSKNYQAFSKIVNPLVNLKSQIFSFLDAILTVLDPDPESVFPIRI